MIHVMRSVLWSVSLLLLMPVGNSIAETPQSQPATEPSYKSLSGLLSIEPVAESPDDDELRRLLKARYNETVAELQIQESLLKTVRVTFDALEEPAHRVVHAGLELQDDPQEQIALLTLYVTFMKEVEQYHRALHEASRATLVGIHKARYQRLDAEIQMLRIQRAAANAKGK